MRVQFLFTRVVGTKTRANFAAFLLRVVLLSTLAALAHRANAATGDSAGTTEGVYVAGQGVSLEQVFKQALSQHPASTHGAFWIVVAGADAARLTRTGAGTAIQGWVKSVRERGGIVYVCRSDLVRSHIKEEDLLDGVIAMYGYGTHEWAGLLPAKKEGVVLPEGAKQSQLILKTCTGDVPPRT